MHHICNQVAWWTWLARAVRQTQRGTSVTYLQSSRWSLCHLSQSSISAYEANTSRWSHKFHPYLCTNGCLQIFVLSTHTSRLEHSACWNPSQVLVVCTLQASQLIWSTKPWHSGGKGRRPLLDICQRTEEGNIFKRTMLYTWPAVCIAITN